jgi:hypothetical protein
MLTRIETSAGKNPSSERLSFRDAAVAFVLDAQCHTCVEVGANRIKLNHGPRTVLYLGTTPNMALFRRRFHLR